MQLHKFLFLALCVPIICGQDIPAPNPSEFTEAPEQPTPTTQTPPSTTIQPPTTTTIGPKEPEETTPSATRPPVDPSVGPPHFNRNLFKWTQYRQFREWSWIESNNVLLSTPLSSPGNGFCYVCGCYQFKHYRDTCECFNYYIHAKANLLRRMYIKRSPWYPCPLPPLRKRIDCWNAVVMRLNNDTELLSLKKTNYLGFYRNKIQ